VALNSGGLSADNDGANYDAGNSAASTSSDPHNFDMLCGVHMLGESLTRWLERSGCYQVEGASTKVIVDVPTGFALLTLEELQGSGPRFIVVTFNPCPEYWEDLWDLKPRVLLVEAKYAHEIHEIADAIIRVDEDDNYQAGPRSETPLNRNQRQVLGYAARGLSNKAIAKQLSLNEKTVTNMLAAIYPKLGVERHAEATLYYWGILGHLGHRG
jgi:DNA-binding CsgD family transcriptional regulator